MGETNTFVFPVNQLGPNGRKLLGYVQQHPAGCGVTSCRTVAEVATIIVPIVLGFGVGGVGDCKGTLAAAWQSSIGNVAAGSLFATLQSMSASGTLFSVVGMSIGVSARALAAANDWAKGVDWAKSVDWAQGANWNGWAQAAGLAGSEAWRKSVDLANEAAKGTVWAANEAAKGTVWAANEAAKGTVWAANEAAKGTVWASNETAQGAGWAANEAVQGAGWAANEAVQGAGWAANEAAKGFGRVFGWW